MEERQSPQLNQVKDRSEMVEEEMGRKIEAVAGAGDEDGGGRRRG